VLEIPLVSDESAQPVSLVTFLGPFFHFHHIFFAAVLKDQMLDQLLLRTLAKYAVVSFDIDFPAGIFGVLATLRGLHINIW
jgi:hypothetical protein